MSLLVIGLILFLGVHSVSIVNYRWRDAMADRLGEWVWKGLYSMLAIAGFVLIVIGYGLARQDPTYLYLPPDWLRHVSMLLLLFVFPLLLAAYLPGRIKRTLKHPMLAAVKAWALAHLLVNGTVADVLLFGGFLIWAGVDRVSVARRPERPNPTAPSFFRNDALAVGGGLALYLVFVMGGHDWLIGVPVR